MASGYFGAAACTVGVAFRASWRVRGSGLADAGMAGRRSWLAVNRRPEVVILQPARRGGGGRSWILDLGFVSLCGAGQHACPAAAPRRSRSANAPAFLRGTWYGTLPRSARTDGGAVRPGPESEPARQDRCSPARVGRQPHGAGMDLTGRARTRVRASAIHPSIHCLCTGDGWWLSSFMIAAWCTTR